MEQSVPGERRGTDQPVSEAEKRALDALDDGDLRGVLTILMDAYGQEIYRYCRQLLSDAELAEDIRQITFVQAFEALDKYTRRSTMRAWLYGIARHRCLDAIRGRRRWRRRFELVEAPDDLPDEGLPADYTSAREAIARALNACLDKLRPAVRTAVVLRHQDGMSYTEMADLLDEKPGTLQARVARALPSLRRCVKNQGVAL